MDIRKLTDEELAVAIRNWTYNSISYPMAESIAPLIRQCVKDSTPKGLTVEEIENLLFPYLSKNWLPTIKEIAQEFHAAQKGKGKSYVA